MKKIRRTIDIIYCYRCPLIALWLLFSMVSCSKPKLYVEPWQIQENLDRSEVSFEDWGDEYPDALFLTAREAITDTAGFNLYRERLTSSDFLIIDIGIRTPRQDSFDDDDVVFVGIDLEEAKVDGKILMLEFESGLNNINERRLWLVNDDVAVFSYGTETTRIHIREDADVWARKFQDCVQVSSCIGTTYKWSPRRQMYSARESFYLYTRSAFIDVNHLSWMER